MWAKYAMKHSRIRRGTCCRRSGPMYVSRGVTLIDTLVASALLIIVFLGVTGAIQLALDVVINSRARAGAITLAQDRMEYVHSLAYDKVGVVGGIPSGSIPQSESVKLNTMTYTRRTYVEFYDDPSDGVGVADTVNGPADGKSVKVDVSWISRTGPRHITFVTRLTPLSGIESSVPGGILTISVLNASSSPVSNAQVRIVNASTTPASAAVDLMTFTDASGTASLIGATSTGSYTVVVNKTGYSTDQTYNVTNAIRPPLTITRDQNNVFTFFIDVLGAKTVQTLTRVAQSTWSDSFLDDSKVATSTDVVAGSGSLSLVGGAPFAASGSARSVTIGPANVYEWGTFTGSYETPSGTSVVFRVYDGSGALVPEAQLPGNGAGFATSSINLSGISTTTFPSLRIETTLVSDGSATPVVHDYAITYDSGGQPLSNVPFSIRGAKTIASTPTYKFNANFSTGADGSYAIPDMEWDTYTISIAPSTGYDIASACNPQPELLLPGQNQMTTFYLTPHTNASLLFEVHDAATNLLIEGATIGLARSGYAATSTTDRCGQTFFGGLTDGAYTYTVLHSGNTMATGTATVSANTTQIVNMN